MENPLANSQPGSVVDETNKESDTLQPLDTELFRRKLAGLVDPDRVPGRAEHETVRQDAIRFVTVLAHLFGESLDRITLWEKIGAALRTSLAKVADGDLDRFANLCLEHIVAEDSKVAACKALLQLLESWANRPPEWRQAFLHYITTHRIPLLVHGRKRWEEVKEAKIEL